ncbi:MAG: ribulose-phosphate 3-epimerase [Clostridiales bacterium]
MIKIAPSILAADFSKLGEEIENIEEAGADIVHIDVMDGNFVPNISIGAPVIKSIRKITNLEFDVHLMVDNPDKHIESFAEAGADIICVHAETCKHLHMTIRNIKKLGKKAAVSLNPSTSLSNIELILHELDMVLIMSVNPGFGGQKYLNFATNKIKDLRKIVLKRDLDMDIEVDGGVTAENIEKISRAGANVFVAGTTIFGSENRKKMIRKLKKSAEI